MLVGAVGLHRARSAPARIIDRFGHSFACSVRHLRHIVGYGFADG